MYKSHGKEYIENNFSPAELAALMKSAPSPPIPPTIKEPKQPLPPLDFGYKLGQQKLQHEKSYKKARPSPMQAQPTQNHHFTQNVVKKQKFRKPGPASKTNAPPEKRGSTSLPTYLQLTQVSRRSSLESRSAKESTLADIIQKLAAAAASKVVKPEEKQACNFCTSVFKTQIELSQHLVTDHFKGLIPLPPVISHMKTVNRAKAIRRSLGKFYFSR